MGAAKSLQILSKGRLTDGEAAVIWPPTAGAHGDFRRRSSVEGLDKGFRKNSY
jgi:hypothetical protein